MDNGPFTLNNDGSAKSPAAFQDALKQDAEKMAALQNEPEVAKIVLGENIAAFQDLLRSTYRVSLPLLTKSGISPG